MRKKSLRLERKNLIISGEKLKRLQKVLRAKSESEAVRLAIDRTLDSEEAITALKRLRERATWGKNLDA
ncbi:MAG TPA: hypothetical protein VNN20_06795 [Thermodesulfobacteriota bacterium]|jgi:hypothetical protein|nr:hypothetical protein [Thermodesulfobacteriota bacterium]